MSRESFGAGLYDGVCSAYFENATRPTESDADYDRGYTLGRQDVLSRLALYDREPRTCALRHEPSQRPNLESDCAPIADSQWPSRAVQALYPDAQYVSEREADG